MKKSRWLVLGMFFAAAIVFLLLFIQNKKYNVQVDLTAEQRVEFEKNIVAWGDKIKETPAGEQPKIDFFVEKARNEEYLGRYGDAIATLHSAFKYYQNSSAAWNNLAKLYEKVGRPRKANEYYQKLIDVFDLYQYRVNVAWNYYRLGNIERARELYKQYQSETGGKDEELEYNLERA